MNTHRNNDAKVPELVDNQGKSDIESSSKRKQNETIEIGAQSDISRTKGEFHYLTTHREVGCCDKLLHTINN